MILLLLLSCLPIPPAVAQHAADTLNSTTLLRLAIENDIGKFKSLTSEASRLRRILPSVDEIIAGMNRPLLDNSTIHVVAILENTTKPDEMKWLKDLVKTTNKYAEGVPEVGQYIKMASGAIDYIISNKDDEDVAARLDILDKLNKIKAEIGEGPFEDIRTQAGTLFQYLIDALAELSNKHRNVNWWRALERFHEVARMRDPEVLVIDVQQLLYSPHRYLIHSAMESDVLKNNVTLQTARVRIIRVLHTLAFVRIFQLALFENEEALKYGAQKVLNRVEGIMNQVDIDVANYIESDTFNARMSVMIENALRNSSKLELSERAKRILTVLEASATTDRFVVILYKKVYTFPTDNPFTGTEFTAKTTCLFSSMVDAASDNLYHDELKSIAIYRSRKLHLMSENEKLKFQKDNGDKAYYDRCQLKFSRDIRNSSIDSGLVVNTFCPDFMLVADSRIPEIPKIAQTCSVFRELGKDKIKKPTFVKMLCIRINELLIKLSDSICAKFTNLNFTISIIAHKFSIFVNVFKSNKKY